MGYASPVARSYAAKMLDLIKDRGDAERVVYVDIEGDEMVGFTAGQLRAMLAEGEDERLQEKIVARALGWYARSNTPSGDREGTYRTLKAARDLWDHRS